MSHQVHRVCPQCGGNVALDARYCPHCGVDTRAGLPVERSSLPAQLGRAALPVAAGLAGFVLRVGWHLLRRRLVHLGGRAGSRPLAPSSSTPPTRRGRRVLRIRSWWAVGDANGVWRQGREEHIIEFDEE